MNFRHFNIKTTAMFKYIMTFIILGGCWACKKNGEDAAKQGETIVKINLVGIEQYADGNGVGQKEGSTKGGSSKNSSEVQSMTVPFGNGCSVDIVLTNDPIMAGRRRALATNNNAKLAADQTTQNTLNQDVKYKVVVYDDQGNYVKEKTYSYGSDAEGISLVADKSYTFIAYSINSKNSVPNIVNQAKMSTASLDNVSGDLMYFAKKLKVTSGTNNLDVIMKHRFSQITTTLTMDPNMTGAITKIENVVFKPTHSSANLKLSDEGLSYNGLNDAGAEAKFPALGSDGLRTVTSAPTLLINPDTTNGSISFGSLTIDEDTKTNVVIPNVRIKPGQQYALKLNFRICTNNVTSDGLNWSYSEETYQGKKGIRKDGTFYPNGSEIDKTFNAPASDYGFTFDITELDNGFNMEVNGVKLAKNEMQFQNLGASSAQNVQFQDGSKYEGNDVETGKKVGNIYDLKGTSTAPLIKVVISRKGEVTMFGSKTSGGKLYPLVLTNNNTFNSLPWNGDDSNTVKVTQLVDGRTVIKGIGSGKDKVSCN